MAQATTLIEGATLDTSVYIGALNSGGVGSRILGMAKAGLIRIDTSDSILAECIRVLRDKFGWEGYRLHFAEIELRKMARCVS